MYGTCMLTRTLRTRTLVTLVIASFLRHAPNATTAHGRCRGTRQPSPPLYQTALEAATREDGNSHSKHSCGGVANIDPIT
jgi:hypothetical protein